MVNLARKPMSLLAPTLLVVFAWAFVFSVGGASSRVMQSYHGLHHSAYVYQIANGLTPPTNPSSLEMPANFYWLWHAALASCMATFDATPFEMSLVSNAIGLSGFLCAMWWLLGAVIKRPGLRLAACGLPFFILNPLGLIQFDLRLASVWIPEILNGSSAVETGLFDHLVTIARHHSSLQMTDNGLASLFPRVGLFESVQLSDRSGHLINKFLNFNSFPLALALFASAHGLLRGAGNPVARGVGLGFVTGCMALVSPLPVAAFGMTVFAMLLVSGAKLAGPEGGEPRLPSSVLWPAAGSAIGVVCALPFILPVASAYQGSFVVLGPGTGLFRHAAALGWALVPSIIVMLLGFWLRRELSAHARVDALSVLFYALAALCLVTPSEDPNEYKFVLLCALPASLLAVEVGRLLWARYGEGRARAVALRRTFTAALIVMSLMPVSIIALLYIASPWASEEPFRFEGDVTSLGNQSDPRSQELDAAYTWLRSSTPTRAAVLVEPVTKDLDRVPVVAQRRVVAQLASPFTHAITHHAALVDAVQRVVRATSRCRLAEADLAPLRAIGLAWDAAPYVLIERSEGASACRPRTTSILDLEFVNTSVAVYRLTGIAHGVSGEGSVLSR